MQESITPQIDNTGNASLLLQNSIFDDNVADTTL